MPEEDPIAPFDRGPVRSAVAAMESDYRTQVYFDLGTNTAVSKILITEWDLGFSSSDSLPLVVLNTAKIMAAADAGAVGFDDVASTSGLTWKYDHPSGHPDSMSIGKWWSADGGFSSLGHIYVIDRGVDQIGKKLGYKKFAVTGYNGESYTVRFADLNGKNDTTITVSKNRQANYTGLSFSSGRTIPYEPPAPDWDIVFTRYTHIFWEPEFTPYSVSGVLLNAGNGVVVAVDTVRKFADITASDVAQYEFSSARDGLGYAWKTYYLDKGEYVVHSNIVYILRDTDGFYYKLHFTDFYNNEGQKGFPAFEYQTL